MKIGVLGTGVVGRVIAGKLLALGNEVRLGSRSADNPTAGDWARVGGEQASHGTFEDAAGFSELIFNCTPGMVSVAVLESLAPEAVAGKLLVDVSNPLDFSGGFPPSLAVVNTDSLGEQIQRALPDTKVVKALNTVNSELMVNPGLLDGHHDLFIAGEDRGAKLFVRSLLVEFGWPADDVHDLGGIAAARGLEMYLPLWLAVMGTVGTATFNVHVVQATHPSG